MTSALPRLPDWVPINSPATDINKQSSKTVSGIASKNEAIPIVYGTQYLPGKIFAVKYLSGVWTVGAYFCIGEIDSFPDGILLNGAAPVAGVTVNQYTGSLTQTADALLSAAISGYADTLVATVPTGEVGIAYAVVQYTEEHYAGLPSFLAKIKGKKVYDFRHNLLLQSQAMDISPWVQNIDAQTTVTANAAVAPDGTTTAEKLFEADAVSNPHGLQQSLAGLVDHTVITCSVYVKSAERTAVHLRVASKASVAIGRTFNLSTGLADAVTASAPSGSGIQSVGNGWYRCWIAADIGTGGAAPVFQFFTMTSSSSVTATYVGTAGSGIYVWGAQVELGIGSMGPGGYMPTTTAAINKVNNLCLQSENFSDALWAKSSASINVTATAIAAPDGGLDAYRIHDDDATASISRFLTSTISATYSEDNTPYTFSCYFKAGGWNCVRIAIVTKNNGIKYATFNISTGLLVNSNLISAYTIEPVGATGWFHCSITATSGAGASAFRVRTYLANNSGSAIYAGSGVAGSGVYAWGAQLYKGFTSQRYAATTTTVLSQYAYSENPAICLGDFINESASGLGQSFDERTLSQVAADNDIVFGATAATEKRRIISFAMVNLLDAIGWLSILSTYAGCAVFRRGSDWAFCSDVSHYANPVWAFTASNHATDSIQISRQDTSNVPTVVRVQYIDSSTTPWQSRDAVASLTGVDTGEVPRRESTVQMPGVNRYSQALREATERLNKFQDNLVVSLDGFDECLQLEVGDVFTVTNPNGISSSYLFRLTEPARMGKPGKVRITGSQFSTADFVTTETSTPAWGSNSRYLGSSPIASDILNSLQQWADIAGIPESEIYTNDDALALGLNPTFENWTGGYPAGYSLWSGGAPTKETGAGLFRVGTSSVKYIAAGTELGMQSASSWVSNPMPVGTFISGAVDIRLESVTSGKPGILVRLYTNAGLSTFVDNKVQPPTSIAGQWQRCPFTARIGLTDQIYGIRVYVMGSWSGFASGAYTGTVYFDNIRLAFFDLSTDNTRVTITAGGVLQGAGGGTVTLGGIGYSGDPAATKNTITTSAADPSGGTDGDLHFNSDSNKWWSKLAGVWTVTATIGGEKEIQNPDFEVGNRGWTLGASNTIQTTTKHQGTKALANANVAGGTISTVNLGDVPCAQDDQILFGGYALITTGTFTNIGFQLEWLTEAKTSISTSTAYTAATNANWVYLRTLATAPATSAFCRFKCVSVGKTVGTSYYDDCFLTRLPKASEINNSSITINADGSLAGAGSGSVTITGLGYAGDLNATNDMQLVLTTSPTTITQSGNSVTRAGGTTLTTDARATTQRGYNSGLVSFKVPTQEAVVGLIRNVAVVTDIWDIDYCIHTTTSGTRANLRGKTLFVTGAVTNGGLIKLTVPNHGLVTGKTVSVANVGGVPNATGTWLVTFTDIDNITLQASTFAGTYTSGGEVVPVYLANSVIVAGDFLAIAYDAATLKFYRTVATTGVTTLLHTVNFTHQATADNATLDLTYQLHGIFVPYATGCTLTNLRFSPIGDVISVSAQLMQNVAPLMTSSDVVLTVENGTTTAAVTYIAPGVFQRSSQAGAWNGEVRSVLGHSAAYVSMEYDTFNFMVGLDSNPSQNASFGSLDYAWYILPSNVGRIYASGVAINNPAGTPNWVTGVKIGDVFAILYDGKNVSWLVNGRVVRTVVHGTPNQPMFLDSSLNTADCVVRGLRFGPIASYGALWGTETGNIQGLAGDGVNRMKARFAGAFGKNDVDGKFPVTKEIGTVYAAVLSSDGTSGPTSGVYGSNSIKVAARALFTVTGAVASGTLIRLTIGTHTLVLGDKVEVASVGGVPNAAGVWTVTAPTGTTIDLAGSTFAGTYTSGGTVGRYHRGIYFGGSSTTYNHVIEPNSRWMFSCKAWPASANSQAEFSMVTTAKTVTGCVANGSLIQLTVAAHGWVTGQRVDVASVGGVPAAIGSWSITYVSASTFTLDGSTFSGTYTSGGTVRNAPRILSSTLTQAVWNTVTGTFDLLADENVAAAFRVRVFGPTVYNTQVWFDGLMLERQVGPGTTGTPWRPPGVESNYPIVIAPSVVSAGMFQTGMTIDQGNGVPQTILTGLIAGEARDGDTITYATAWANTPTVIWLPGALVSQNGVTGEANVVYQAINSSTTGFTARIRVVGSYGTVVSNTENTGAQVGSTVDRELNRRNLVITAMTGNAVTPIVCTTAAHGLTNNQKVIIRNSVGNTAANGTWTATVVSTTQFSIAATGNGVYTASSGDVYVDKAYDDKYTFNFSVTIQNGNPEPIFGSYLYEPGTVVVGLYMQLSIGTWTKIGEINVLGGVTSTTTKTVNAQVTKAGLVMLGTTPADTNREFGVKLLSYTFSGTNTITAFTSVVYSTTATTATDAAGTTSTSSPVPFIVIGTGATVG